MADGESAPEVTGQPEQSGQGVGQPDWQTERAEFERKIADMETQVGRYKQQLDGSNKAFQALRDRGYRSIDDVLPDIEAVAKVRKSGLDLRHLASAYQADEPTGEQEFLSKKDLASFKAEMFEEWNKAHAQASRGQAIGEAFRGISETITEHLKDEPDFKRRFAQSFLENELSKRLMDDSADPKTAFKEVWTEYQSLAKSAYAQQAAAEVAEIGDAAQKSSPRVGTKQGGQGNPQSNTGRRERGLMGVDRADLVAETERRLKASRSGKTSALS